jgi:hypothetical protein
MNYMSEVAKMLGVELGEVFYVIDSSGKKISPNYYITVDGILSDTTPAAKNMGILNKILCGEYTIKRKPWKPQVDDYFWYIDADGTYVNDVWDNDSAYCLNLYKLGNCYCTEKEAEADYYKWIAFYASNEVLEV